MNTADPSLVMNLNDFRVMAPPLKPGWVSWPWAHRKHQSLELARANEWKLVEGDLVGVKGISGCGKSSFLRALAGNGPLWARKWELGLTPGQSLVVSGDPCDALLYAHVPKAARVAFAQRIPQDPLQSWSPYRTVGSQLRLVWHWRPKHARPRWSFVGDLLEKLGLHSSILEHFPKQVSGGQVVLLSLIRGLLLRPRLLLCDEIFSALSPHAHKEVIRLLRTLQSQWPFACVLVSHVWDTIPTCDRYYEFVQQTLVPLPPHEKESDNTRSAPSTSLGK